jgi:type I restriction enzyme, S subunit
MVKKSLNHGLEGLQDDTEGIEGYKKTEVGVIPDDWEVFELSQVVETERPISYGIVQTGKHIENGIRCIRVIDIFNGRVNKDNLIRTSEEISNSYKRTILKKGDLIIALRGKIGELAVIDQDLVDSNLTRGLALIASKKNNHNYFLYYYLSSPIRKLIFEKNLNGSALKEISIGVLRKIPVPLPPTLEEQKTIAQSLSDVDALITECDRIITKKRNTKQGTMQQLLTGKKRLPGFSGEWEVEELGNIALLERGKFSARPRNDPKFFGGDIPFIQTGDVTKSNGVITTYNQSLNHQGLRVSKLFPANTLFFTIAANIGDIGIASFETACPDSLIAITPQARIDKKWLFHALKSRKKSFEGLATQNAQLNINLEKLKPYLLTVPAISEQKAIAQVLSDMDTEIAGLEQKCDKYKAIKQGMMQELLTGRTRLKYDLNN